MSPTIQIKAHPQGFALAPKLVNLRASLFEVSAQARDDLAFPHPLLQPHDLRAGA